MRRTRIGVAAVVACSAMLAAVGPAMAGSSGNPQWSVSGSTLKTGETHELSVEGAGIQKLRSLETTVACSSASVEPGATIIGGGGATEGTASEKLIYSGCEIRKSSTEETIAGCKVNSVGAEAGTLKSNQLLVKLAYASAPAAEKEEPNTVTVFTPESGTTFLQLEMSGENCPLPGNGKYNVEGQLTLKNPESASEKARHAAEAPESGNVKTFYLNNGGLPKEEKTKLLKVSGAQAGYIGTLEGELSGGSSWAAVK